MTESPETLNTHAIELASKGNFAEAIACFKRAISMENSNYLLWYNLGVTYRDSGNLQAAKQVLLTAYKLDNTDEELLDSLTLVCFALDETDDAFEYCSENIEIKIQKKLQDELLKNGNSKVQEREKVKKIIKNIEAIKVLDKKKRLAKQKQVNLKKLNRKKKSKSLNGANYDKNLGGISGDFRMEDMEVLDELER